MCPLAAPGLCCCGKAAGGHRSRGGPEKSSNFNFSLSCIPVTLRASLLEGGKVLGKAVPAFVHFVLPF